MYTTQLLHHEKKGKIHESNSNTERQLISPPEAPPIYLASDFDVAGGAARGPKTTWGNINTQSLNIHNAFFYKSLRQSSKLF